MSYCSVQDLIDRFGEKELIDLTDELNTGEINQTQMSRTIADVAGYIDSYLSSRYTLPLTEIPPVLNKYACDLVRYQLYDAPSPAIEKHFDDASKFLRDVANGKASLGINQSGSEPKTNNSATVQHAGNVFGRGDKGFM